MMKMFFVVAFDDNGEDWSAFVAAHDSHAAADTWRDGIGTDMHPPEVKVYECPNAVGCLSACVVDWEDIPTYTVRLS